MEFNIDQFLKCGAIMSLTQDRLLLGWGAPHKTVFTQIDQNRPAFYFNDFFLNVEEPWVQYSNWLDLSVQEFNDYLKSEQPLPGATWILHQPEKFKKGFDELSKDLHAGRLKKAVPYLFAKSFDLMTEERLCNSLQRGIASLGKKSGYIYGHWNGQEGILGVTPESLFSHSNEEPQTIHTMAVAGTSHPSQDQDSFFQNDKERHEHHLVVQGICQSLEQLGKIKVGAVQLLPLPKLVHLFTPIELTLDEPFQFDPLVQKLHPTPALGAFPVIEGKKWLDAFDQHTPRLFYGAPTGFYSPPTGFSRCLVAIRNVQWNSSGMRIGAGCGVVKQSTFENEWHEIQIKIRAIRDQLHL